MTTVGWTLASLLSFAPPPAGDAPTEVAPIEAPAPTEAPPAPVEPPPLPPEAPPAAPVETPPAAEAPPAAPVEPPPTAEAPPAPAPPPVEPPVEAPVIVVTPTPPAAPAPAPAPPPPIPNWGPQADVVVSQPSPPRPQPIAPLPRPFQPPPKPMMGVGLFIGSSIAFGVGLGARVGQVDVAMSNCRDWSGAGFNSLTSCFDYYDSPGVDSNDLFVGAAYGSSMVMTMIGAGALGRYSAWQSVYGDLRSRNPVARYAFGAIFTGLGVASIGAHYALIYADAKNPCTSWECNVQRRALWIAASDGGAFMLNTGFGLFSWAGNYRNNLERYRKMHWSVIPGVSPGSVGATASLRF